MRSRVTDLFGIDYPVIQAPMAGVSTPALAAAVSNAGALGSVGVGAAGPDGARKMMREIRALTNKPYHVNFFAHPSPHRNEELESAWIDKLAPLFREFGAEPPSTLKQSYASFLEDAGQLAVVIEERPPIVSFHFGLPIPTQIAAMRDAGVTLVASATSLEEAVACEEAGMDAIIVQGFEAGGHRGVHARNEDLQLGLFALLPQVADAVSIPLIAAGGIADGRAIAAAFALGAEAVQIGTAFVACPESSAGARHRAILGTRAARKTIITRGVSGRAARGFTSRMLDAVLRDEGAAPDYPIAYDAAKRLADAVRAADADGFEVMWAGEAAALARPLPAAELVDMLMRKTHERLDELSRLKTAS
ncbi:MAG: nitronate monooxygenase [Parvularculaceae bacterium]